MSGRKDWREVVVTGIAMTTPLGDTYEENTTRCFAGDSNFAAISLFDTKGGAVRFAGEHSTPNSKALPDRKTAKILNRRDQTSVMAAAAAFAEARLAQAAYEPHRLGLFVGASCTNLGDLTPYLPLVAKHADLAHGTFDSSSFGREFMDTFNPVVVLQLLMNNAACYGSIALQIKGVNSNYMQYETSGLRAIGEGFLAVAEGRADAVLAGGTAQPIEPFQTFEAYHLGLLADQTGAAFDPNEAIKPYDELAKGTVLSEGSVYLVLEDGAKARARGARIHGRVCGFGLASDGEPDLPFAPRGRTSDVGSSGLVRAMAAAFEQGGVTVGELGGVVGSAAGVPSSDASEALALKAMLGEDAGHVPICSLKGSFGELLETSGAAGAAMALAAIERRILPPTRNFDRPSAAARGLKIAATPQPMAGELLAVLSRSRFGVAAALLVGPAE